MAYQTIEIRPDGNEEPYFLEVTARDALLFEKTSRKGMTIFDYLTKPSMTELYRMAHLVAKREQRFTGSLKEFEAAHECVVQFRDEDDEEPDPTRSAASADD
jgi:hypothetical protein